MPTRIQVRRGTSAEWATANPVLAAGEIGLDLTVDKIKIGDGSANWAALPFAGLTPAEITTLLAGKQNTLVSGTSIKTINSESLLGSGNIVISGGSGTSDHGALTGLADDDHTQYFNAARLAAVLADYATVSAVAAAFQPIDSDLTAIAALSTTAFGRALLTQVDAAATRATIGAGTSNFNGAYGSLSGIPSSFNPSAHNHAIADTTGLQAAIDGKQETLVSGTNIKTVNGVSVLGSGDIVISGGGGTSDHGSLSGLGDDDHTQYFNAARLATELASYATTSAVAAAYQPLDSDLTAIAALSTTSFGRSLLTQADAAATRATIGAGTSNFDGAYGSLSGVPATFAPSAHNHAASEITSGTLAIGRIPLGTTASTVCVGNDARLSDARTPTAHAHGNITNVGAIGSTANLPLITGASGVVTVGSFGTTANTFCQGNDARLSDARTPTAHVHGGISNAGAIGTTANLPIITGASGVLQAGSFGTTANSFCQGNDARLSDARTPTAHNHAIADVTGLQVALNAKQNDLLTLPLTEPAAANQLFWKDSILARSISSNPLDSISGVRSWVADPARVTLSGSDITAWNESYAGTQNFSFASLRPVWSATGGPKNGPFVSKPVGRNLQFGSAPIVGSPYTIYAVVRTPTIIPTGRVIWTGNRGGGNGLVYDSATDSYYYIGQGANFSTRMYDVQRTQWMLVTCRITDNNTMAVEINDEPVSFRVLDQAGSTQTTILDWGTTYDGIEIAEMSLIPSVLSAADNAAVKEHLVAKYNLKPPAKKVLFFGDSHMDGVQSGSPVGAPFRTNLLTDEPGLSIVRLSQNGTCAANNNGPFDFADQAPIYAQPKWSDYKIVLCYGTNDAATATGAYGWTSWANWTDRYRSDIRRFLDAGWNPRDICIMTPPLTTGAYVAGNLTTVKNAILQIGQELGLTIIDWWQLCTDAAHDINGLGGDGIHGNNVTHAFVRAPLANFI